MKMNKVYIITSGEYSDYCIERVFLNEDKANAYLDSVEQDSYYNYTIEEFDLDDDKSFEIINYVDASYHKIQSKEHEKNDISVEIRRTNTLDDNIEDLKKVDFYRNENGVSIITVRKVLPDGFVRDKVLNKYEYILKAVMSDSLYEYSQGKSHELVNKRLKKSVEMLDRVIQ